MLFINDHSAVTVKLTQAEPNCQILGGIDNRKKHW